MKEFIEFIAKHLVDKPDAVRVEETEENNKINFKLFVDDPETGKVIGKAGKTAKAIRTLLTAIAAKEGKRAFLEIPDKINKDEESTAGNDSGE
ncbi:MAG TPA: KH domain-containing protein [Ignavibacteria bacterium]|nr:KH domain-containing protein [Ignavibacteria bacterium]